MGVQELTVRELNRALLARQGLLEPLAVDVVAAIEAIGAVQAQQWSAPPVALWSRVAGFRTASLHEALAAGNAVVGTLLRGTLHLVSAREHPAYAAVAEQAGVTRWDRSGVELPESAATLRPAVREFCANTPRSDAQIAEFLDSWVAANPTVIPDAEVTWQRAHGWRPVRTTPDLVRAPAGEQWAKGPKLSLAAPRPAGAQATALDSKALIEVARRHLRAFGPATADDVACWTGARTRQVRTALEGQDDLLRATDPAGRTLYDLPDAPRPDEGTPAPVRFLAAFDSALLAYHASRRERILPPTSKDAVYSAGNLRVLATFLVDGLVAGTWTATGRTRAAELTLTPAADVNARQRRELETEAERLLAFLYPGATPTITWG
ncbi:winged helix DNA-binding domain-containing protein [Frankia sp. R82]|uniref:winged helix DNA-binding domain-containing protein n=1 Tax=Frankia sp. R82 TaxID=2950553 RepID=UPI0020437550|nr:winged helix DNA-binding domain-containing protein [Frankia sp. R82]MCM3887249.1 winged helix DNA-binding domain-containing protein [Frankia sp. R82]